MDQREIIQVDFDFFNPAEIDFHALKGLLNQLFEPEGPVDTSSLSDAIIKQGESLGTTIKAEGELDPYAFISILNLNIHKVGRIACISLKKRRYDMAERINEKDTHG
jgi:protein BCP1